MPKAHPSTFTGQIMMLAQPRSMTPSVPTIQATSPLRGISPMMAMPRAAPAPSSIDLWDQIPEPYHSLAREVIRRCCGKVYSTEDAGWCRDMLNEVSRMFAGFSTQECTPELPVVPGGGGGGVPSVPPVPPGGGGAPMQIMPVSVVPCFTALQLSAFAMAARYFAACRDRVFPPTPKFGTSVPIGKADLEREEYNRGMHDGGIFCEKLWAYYGSTPEGIAYRGSDTYRITSALAGKSESYKHGFLDGKEICEKTHAKGSPKFNEAYENGRAAGFRYCAENPGVTLHHLPLAGSSAYNRLPDYNRGYLDAMRYAGCAA